MINLIIFIIIRSNKETNEYHFSQSYEMQKKIPKKTQPVFIMNQCYVFEATKNGFEYFPCKLLEIGYHV